MDNNNQENKTFKWTRYTWIKKTIWLNKNTKITLQENSKKEIVRR